jgi:amidohydrolase
MDISKIISGTKVETIELRRDFHRHPELGMQEFRTGDKVADYLNACGLEVSRLNKTGVCGLLTGNQPGPTLLMRADMDALPIAEACDLPYKSVSKGVMHACGHDAHTAMLMVAAKILSGLKEQLRGNIKFVFEPNEENVGALAMIEEGLMDNPRVDACMGLHVWNQLPTGQVGITPGPVMAGMEHFDLTIVGRGGHTATPQSAVDPILGAAAVIQGVQAIQTREIDVLKEPTIIIFGKIQGGTASNVIPDSVALSGTMRYLFEGSKESPDHPKHRFERMVSNICAAHRTGYELNFLYGHPSLVNHWEMTELMRGVAASDLGKPLELVSFITLAGEDFSEFAARAPGIFCFLGAGKPGEKNYPHHHPRFDIDEEALQTGVELLVRGALRFFEKAPALAFMKKEVE